MTEARERLEERLSAYLDGELAEDERADVDDLLERDPEAARLLDRLRGLSAALDEDTPPPVPDALVPGIRDALRAAPGPPAARATRRRGWRRPQWIAGAAAAAACVLAAVVVLNLPPDERLLPQESLESAETAPAPAGQAPREPQRAAPEPDAQQPLPAEPDAPRTGTASEELSPGSGERAAPDSRQNRAKARSRQSPEQQASAAARPTQESANELATEEAASPRIAEERSPAPDGSEAARSPGRRGPDDATDAAPTGRPRTRESVAASATKSFRSAEKRSNAPPLPTLEESLGQLGCAGDPVRLRAVRRGPADGWPPPRDVLAGLAQGLDGALAREPGRAAPLLVVPPRAGSALADALGRVGGRLVEGLPPEPAGRCAVVRFASAAAAER